MGVTPQEKEVLRTLGRRVAEIAALPDQEVRRRMWKRLNRLERVRPLIQTQAYVQDIWDELIPPDQMQCADPYWRAHELDLRKRIYVWENFRDDRVIDDVVGCPYAIYGRISGFGMKVIAESSTTPLGARAYRTSLVEERDIEKIQTEAHIRVDWEETERRYERLCDVFGGILRVEKQGPNRFGFSPMDQFIKWRGIEQMFMDLVDRPAWVHEALERMTRGYLSDMLQLEQLHLLSPGNGNVDAGSGGYCWTDDLPQPDFDGEHVRLKDLWARAMAQIFAGVSADMHEEFALQYERRLLAHFGLTSYGCCEPLDRKMRILRKIPNLRRVSMSPWVDIERASAAVGRDYVYTHKPNPAVVSMGEWDPELARRQLRDAFEKTRDNVVEVNLQDLHTVRNQPHRLREWTRIALQLAEEYA
ncbi:MAG: hypothetical protein HY321_22865 [Armatimonadetes bacterium]|nr:hypothetical protein [Armatimonadota bacterium]